MTRTTDTAIARTLRFPAAGWPQELERPAIERRKSKIVVSYKSSEFTSNAILTGLRTSRPSTRNSMASFTLATDAGEIEAVNKKPKAMIEHIGAHIACSAARSRPLAGT